MKLPQIRLPRAKEVKSRLPLALGFILPCFGMLCIMLFGGYEPFGDDRSMLYSDMYHQYYPFFVAFRKNLLSGDSLLFSWDVGLGMDYLGLISYYLCSPLNLLSILVPEHFTLEYFSLLVPLKLGFAGFFFAYFLKKIFGKNDLSISFFGAFYGTCAWALGYQWNVMWLDTFALLPLVVLGMVYLLRDKKFMLYTISLFLAVCINYYVGFFVCIFVFLLFICYEVCRFPGFKRMGLDLCRIALFSVIAIGMTAFVELPAFAALQNTQSSVNTFPTGFDLNIADQDTWMGLLDAMRQVAGRMGGGLEHTFKEGLPNIYSGVFALVLAFLYLTAKEIRLRDKICAVSLLLLFMVSFIVRQLDYIWHGFHFPNQIPYRFSFLYSFVMLYMAYHAWTLRKNFQLWQYVVAMGLSACIILCSDSMENTVFPIFNFALIALHAGIGIYVCIDRWIAAKRIKRDFLEEASGEELEQIAAQAAPAKALERHNKEVEKIVFAVTCVVMSLELILNLVTFGTRFPYTTITGYPKGTYHTESMINYLNEREKASPFFRTEVTHTQTLNDGALNGYYGISTFTSSANVRVTEFIQALGFSAKNTYNRYCFEEASPVSNLFLNLKYMIERDGDVEENNTFDLIHTYGDVSLLENNAYLPLGFLANSPLSEVDMHGRIKSFSLQNTLLQAAAGIDEGPWYPLGEGCLVVLGSPSATIGTQTSSGYTSYSTSNAATIRYTYTADRDGFFCVDMNMPMRNSFTVSHNSVELYKESISLPQMYGICEVKKGDSVMIDVICGQNESTAMSISAAIMDHERFRESYDVLSASTLNVTSFSNAKISGTIDCDRTGLMYTSIPYDGNWEAEVDGKPAEIVIIGNAMCGLELTEGSHTVTFTYRNKAFTLGLAVSVASTLALAAAYLFSRSSPKAKGKFEN